MQTLDTMRKIKEINDYARVTLDKLQGIQADLVRIDDNWQDWKFQQLVEALQKWTVRNPEEGNSYSKVTRLNKLRATVCTVRNLTINLLILKLQTP